MSAAGRFWPFLDEVAASSADASAESITRALRLALPRLPARRRREMGLRFAEATWELHSYDVWGCASIVCGGGLSDDGFVYWRRWLVLQGSSLYRSIFKNPDAALADYWQSVGLTELANESVYDYCNGERAQYVFDDYAGGSPPRSKRLEYLMRRRPRGRAWANQAELRQRFPALVRLFGG